jgi:hypothetical protein
VRQLEQQAHALRTGATREAHRRGERAAERVDGVGIDVDVSGRDGERGRVEERLLERGLDGRIDAGHLRHRARASGGPRQHAGVAKARRGKVARRSAECRQAAKRENARASRAASQIEVAPRRLAGQFGGSAQRRLARRTVAGRHLGAPQQHVGLELERRIVRRRSRSRSRCAGGSRRDDGTCGAQRSVIVNRRCWRRTRCAGGRGFGGGGDGGTRLLGCADERFDAVEFLFELREGSRGH